MLTYLNNNWFRYASGKKWRIRNSDYLCEVEEENNIPSYLHINTAITNIKRVKKFYLGKIKAGILDENGTAIDIIVANAMTESLGTVPSPLEYNELHKIYNQPQHMDAGSRLDEVVRYIASIQSARYLERREPLYINPLKTPKRVSLGSHHMLIATALDLLKRKYNLNDSRMKEDAIIELSLSLPSQSSKAAQLAIDYLNRNYAKHQNQLPLIAATYNAGAPRYTSKNAWNIVQYGQHIDRWIAYYNTSRKC